MTYPFDAGDSLSRGDGKPRSKRRFDPSSHRRNRNQEPVERPRNMRPGPEEDDDFLAGFDDDQELEDLDELAGYEDLAVFDTDDDDYADEDEDY